MKMKNFRISSIECWNTDNMERLHKIYAHPLWKLHMDQLREAEKERIFCKHGIEHLLDVARIAYIENLEENRHVAKELIYAAALLHDIGRYAQYSQGISHETAGVEIASEILKDCEFKREEQDQILAAIADHRNGETKRDESLAGLINRADKKSRMCGFCMASSQCNWNETKKNYVIKV